MGPKMDSLSLRYFSLHPAQPPLWIRQTVFEGAKARSVMPAVFSLLLPLPTAAFLHHQWRNEKLRLRSWKLEPNPTAIREGPTERKTALETTGNTIRRLRGIKIRCWTATCCKGSVSLDSCKRRYLIYSIPDGFSQKCEKTRFSKISRLPTRLMPDITVFTKCTDQNRCPLQPLRRAIK
jgi:hypothetical protein